MSIHCFKSLSRNLVLDVNSGAIHQTDDDAFAVLKKMQAACDEAEFSQALLCGHQKVQTEIRALIEAGQLFSPEKDGINRHMNVRRPVVKALCLHVAHECNLRCRYCFAGQGNYGDTGLMSAEVGKRALDFLIENSGRRKNLEVDFFGGEPLLNFAVVKELIAYGRVREKEAGKNFRFTLTTNAALVSDEVIECITLFDNIVLSLDGRPDVNDRMRVSAGGGGSHDKVLPKIKAVAAARGHEKYYVRGTYTRYNSDFAADVLYLADAGFKHISVEPVVAPPGEDYAIRQEDLPVLLAEYDKLLAALAERERQNRGVHFFHFEIDPSGGPCIARRVTGCGAGSEYLAVTPSGKLYPCHQFVGDERFQIGDIFTGIKNSGTVQEFAACNVYAKDECVGCFARYHCGGGCMATAYYANGSILKPDFISCELMRKRVECGIGLLVERAEGKTGEGSAV